MKTGAPIGNQHARKKMTTAPPRRVSFTPKLWAVWLNERFGPTDEHVQHLAAGIQEFRDAFK